MRNYVIKLCVSGILLFLIFVNVDLGEAMAAASSLPARSIFMVILLQLGSNTVAAYRWFLIMRRIGCGENFFYYLQSYYKGTFFNQGLPTSIGGDAVRIHDCARRNPSMSDCFHGVFIDRFIGLAGLLILNIIALTLNNRILPPHIHVFLLTTVCLLLGALAALLLFHRIALFRNNRYLSFIGQLSRRYQQVYADPVSVFLQLGLSIAIHLMAMTAFFILGVGIGLDFSLGVYLVLVPPVVLLTILPISLAGWGIREGAMIGFFLLVGADRSRVLTFSLLYGLLALTCSLPGLAVYLLQKSKV